MARMTVRGCELDYDIRGGGDAAPLVWGHGLTGSRGISAAYPLVDLRSVEAKRQVVRYDALGHGMSDPLDDPKRGSWAELALDQISLIDQLGLGQVAIGGVSMGAGTALHAALALGDRVERLVLVIPPTGWDERAPQVALYEQSARLVETEGPKAIVAVAAKLPPPDPFRGSEAWVDRRAGSIGAADPARLAACMRGAAFADLPSIDQLATIRIPTLVLAWSGDPGHPVSTAETLGETMPNIDVHIASTATEHAEWSTLIANFV